MPDARIDYVELPSGTAHELTRAFYSKAFGWAFTDYGPTYSATTNGTTDLGLQGDPSELAFSAIAGHPRRRSRGGFRCRECRWGRDRQAHLQLPRRPALPLHRPVGQRACSLERDLAGGSGPGMGSHAIADTVDAGLASKVDGEPACARERLAVELEPARRTTPGQPPVGHRDVCCRARLCQPGPVDAVR